MPFVRGTQPETPAKDRYTKDQRLSRLLAGAYLDLGDGPKDTLFVAGSGRSGTTWLADKLNPRRDHRLLFEPFHPAKVPLVPGFHRRQYLRPDDRSEIYAQPIQRILSGAVRNRWVDRFHRTFVARKRIVKDIRANLMLGWMRENFPEMPIVLLLRHPCAVAESQLSLGWKDILDETLDQGQLVEDYLTPIEAKMRSSQDPFERRVFLWCVENYVPLKQLADKEMTVAFYENLVADPVPELRRISGRLGMTFDEAAAGEIERPSPVSRRNKPPSLDGWRHRISEDQRRKAIEILALFNLDRIYGEDEMPDAEGVRGFVRSND